MATATFALCFTSPSEAAGADKWAAIAYAFDTGGHGYAYGYDTIDAAKENARQECLRYGSSCTVVVWVRNACAALAIGYDSADAPAGKIPDGKGFSTNQASHAAAEAEALSRCSKTARHCFVVRSVCATQ